MNPPLAYFLTFRTYGTWLHGDERGSVDWRNAHVGLDLHPPNAAWERWERQTMNARPFILTHDARGVVAQVIRDHCRIRLWELHECAVRSNHVHIVLSAFDRPVERALSELKAWSSRRLREQRLCTARQRVWAHHGSTRYLWTDRDVDDAMRYVREYQDEPMR